MEDLQERMVFETGHTEIWLGIDDNPHGMDESSDESDEEAELQREVTELQREVAERRDQQCFVQAAAQALQHRTMVAELERKRMESEDLRSRLVALTTKT